MDPGALDPAEQAAQDAVLSAVPGGGFCAPAALHACVSGRRLGGPFLLSRSRTLSYGRLSEGRVCVSLNPAAS